MDPLVSLFGPADDVEEMPESLPPEMEEGNIEYKLKLVNPSDCRFEHLVTQMKWRLQEGQGEAIYEIGVEDSGLLAGLTHQEMVASLQTLSRMAHRLGADISVLREKQVECSEEGGKTKQVAEVLVRKVPDSQQFIDLRLAVLGNVDAGKSTLLGVLTQGELDNGRGRARLNLFRHLHEIQSGRTSSISHEILGFNSKGEVVNYSESRTAEEICENSTKLITLIDLCGHHKYLKTTVFGLTGYSPDFAMLVVSANTGIVGTTKEHLGFALALRVPIFVVVTKIDMCRPLQVERCIRQVEKLLKSPGCKKIPFRVQNEDDAVTAASSFHSERYIVGVRMTGEDVEIHFKPNPPNLTNNISLISDPEPLSPECESDPSMIKESTNGDQNIAEESTADENTLAKKNENESTAIENASDEYNAKESIALEKIYKENTALENTAEENDADTDNANESTAVEKTVNKNNANESSEVENITNENTTVEKDGSDTFNPVGEHYKEVNSTPFESSTLNGIKTGDELMGSAQKAPYDGHNNEIVQAGLPVCLTDESLAGTSGLYSPFPSTPSHPAVPEHPCESAPYICPIFRASSVTGANLGLLTKFLNVLPPLHSNKEREHFMQQHTAHQIDVVYSVPDVGIVVGGALLRGTIKENEQLLVGPNDDGQFAPVLVNSIHRNRLPSRIVTAGQAASLGIGHFSDFPVRKGMVLISPYTDPTPCIEFEAEVYVLFHTNYICKGFQTVVHVGNVCQTAKIIHMDKGYLQTNEKAKVVFRFNNRPEYIRPGSRLIFREGRTKGMGEVTKILPYESVTR